MTEKTVYTIIFIVMLLSVFVYVVLGGTSKSSWYSGSSTYQKNMEQK